MTVQTLTSPDLAVGEQIQIQVVSGDGVVFLTVIGSAGGGGGSGSVTDVTGTAPIVITGAPTVTPNVTITPATDGAAGSMSAADKTKLDAIPSGNLWPFDAPIPAAAVAPELAQAQAIAGGGQPITMRTQAAAAGSALQGGGLQFILGKDDLFSNQPGFFFGYETLVGGLPPATNIFGMATLRANAGGVVILTIGGGSNGSGAGMAAAEISAFAEMNLATEGNNAPINIQPASSFGGQAFWGFLQDPGTGLPGVQIGTAPGDLFASVGVFRLAWDTSTTAMHLLAQRDVSNSFDFDIIARSFSELIFGSFSESNRYHGRSAVLFELLQDTGTAWNFSGPNGQSFNISADNRKTVRQGCNSGEDGFIKQAQSTDLATTANQTIATIDMASGGGTSTFTTATEQLRLRVVGRDTVTGEWASFDLVSCFNLAAGVVTGPTVAATPVDTGHSAGGIPTTPLSFVISGTLVLVQVGPFAATASHWTVNSERVVNTGTF
jgi:hypothetical protein